MNSVIKHSVFILMLFFCLSSTAENRYLTRLIENGTMVFFNPTKVPSQSKGYSFIYDMTLLSNSDTVGINMTLTAKENRIQNVSLHSGDASFDVATPTIFYSDMNGKNFDTRIHLECPKTLFEKLFTQKEPLEITIGLADSTRVSFVYKNGVWEEEKRIVAGVLNLYR